MSIFTFFLPAIRRPFFVLPHFVRIFMIVCVPCLPSYLKAINAKQNMEGEERKDAKS
jgi:hypothetical protein